jgi:hypothetical protein
VLRELPEFRHSWAFQRVSSAMSGFERPCSISNAGSW